MADWKWIGIESKKVRGPNAKYAALLDVDIKLDSTPPPEWERLFLHPSGIPISMGMHPPKLSGSVITIMCPDNEMKQYLEHVDTRVENANNQYERQVLPVKQAEEIKEQREKDAARKRIEDAQREADKL